jgi:uncharacterized protein (TIGR02118 family)
VIKRVSLVRRKAGMGVEEFHRYWRDVHAPLALAVPGLRRYVQSQTLLETYETAEPPAYDGIVETWWDSVEASEAARRTPERALVDADQSNFIGASAGLIATEVACLDEYPDAAQRRTMLKSIAIMYRRSDVPVEAFQTHWRGSHGPVFAKRAGLRRYVQTHPLPETYHGPSPPACDGLATSWWDSLEAYRTRVIEPEPLDPVWTGYRGRVERILTCEIPLLG